MKRPRPDAAYLAPQLSRPLSASRTLPVKRLSLTPVKKRPRLQCGQSVEENPQGNRFGSGDKTVLLPAYVRDGRTGANGKPGGAHESVGTRRCPDSDEIPTSGTGADPDGGG